MTEAQLNILLEYIQLSAYWANATQPESRVLYANRVRQLEHKVREAFGHPDRSETPLTATESHIRTQQEARELLEVLAYAKNGPSVFTKLQERAKNLLKRL